MPGIGVGLRRKRLLRPGVDARAGGGGGAVYLPFSDAFTRADGAIGNGWTGATWTVSSNAAVCAPTLGADTFVLNGGFASDAASWTAVNGGTLESVVGGQAGNCLRMTNVGATWAGARQAPTVTTGTWYQYVSYLYKGTAANTGYRAGTSEGGAEYFSGSNVVAAWTQKLHIFRATATALYLQFSVGSTTDGQTALVDSVTVQPLTLASLFCTRIGANGIDVSINVTRTSNTQAGVVLALNSAAAPTDFILAYVDADGKPRLDKCTAAGGYVSVITGAVAYAAGRTLRVVKSGTDVSLYYNAAQVGTTQTVSDATLQTGALYGLFSTYSANILDSLVAVAA